MGTLRGHLDGVAALAWRLVLEVQAGKPTARRDTVALARAVLESDVVRAAEGVLEADDRQLPARALELAEMLLAGNATSRSVGPSRRAPKRS